MSYRRRGNSTTCGRAGGQPLVFAAGKVDAASGTVRAVPRSFRENSGNRKHGRWAVALSWRRCHSDNV